MARFRTIRQHRHRARRGQVSAVATVLTLLLIVLFIASFVLEQLPNQMSQLEFDHVTQVENQISRLQATVVAQAENPSSVALALSSPVTLGSQGLPPFGAPTSGSIGAESSTVGSSSHYSVGQVIPQPPKWGQGVNPCASGTSIPPCAMNGVLYIWNFTGLNRTTLTIRVAGGGDGLVYNFLGNNDTITVIWTGSDTTFVRVVISGSDNVVNYVKSGSDTGNPVVNFLIYGQRDRFTFSPSGSSSGVGGMTLGVSFVGTNGKICPYANYASTDTVGALGTGGTNINMTVVWWNSIGRVTPVHLQAYPGGAIPTETIRWSNQSAGFLACAFSTVVSSTYSSVYTGGLDVHAFNRYTPQADVVYEAGGVLLAQSGGSAEMVSPPDFSVTPIASGLAGSATLVNLQTNVTAQGGTQTAALTSLVTSVTTLKFSNSGGGALLSSTFVFAVTTFFPSAWIQYFGGSPSVFPGGGTCTPTQPIFAPYTCALPPSGVAVTVSATLTLQQLTLTVINVQVSLG